MKKYSDAQLEAMGLRPQLPRHVGIIMDGNGRYAKAKGQPRSYGHRMGMERVTAVVRLASDLGIGALTVYAFSTENWARPIMEQDTLFSLLVEYFTRDIDELKENGVQVRCLGDLDRFPDRVQRAVRNAEEKTRDCTGMVFSIALNYGSRAEVARAARLLAEDAAAGTLDPAAIDYELLAGKLYTAGLPDPDLIIRTSGESRLSNFLMLQAAYAELCFVPEFWPDYSDERFLETLREYQKRDRRFGGLSPC